MPNWYSEYWVCLGKKCDAIHWYRPNKCRRCGHQFLGRREKVEQELRLHIDEMHLEKELKIQAQMCRVWSEKVAEAQHRYDLAKSELDITEAELSLQIRKNPEAFDIDKINNDVVNAAITVHPEHKIATKKVIKCRYELDVAKAAVNGIQDKKRALSNLTELYVHQYYSESSVEPGTQKGEDMKERARTSARKRMQQQEDSDREFE